MIVIIDYGMGNLPNVKRAIEQFTEDVIISSKKSDIIKSDKMILPGVGAFGDAMRNIDNLDLRKTIIEQAKIKPMLGICLGQQILFEKSEEDMTVDGLGLIKGKVKKFPGNMGLKVPEIGWNSVKKPRESKVLEPVSDESYFYFVHSYYVEPEEDVTVGVTNYGIDFAAVVEKGKLMACQFHPEKSHDEGLKILRKFVNI